MAAGVLALISTAGVLLLAALTAVFWNGIPESSSSTPLPIEGKITVGAILALAAGFAAAGIGCVSGERWGRIALMALSATIGALLVIPLVAFWPDGLGALMPVLWCALMFGLSAVGRPWAR